jgi:tripartite-type tricarboxylate transporter receptor subunit TctC
MNMQLRVFVPMMLALAVAGAACAQESFPAKPMRLVLPGPPGNITDLMARVLSKSVGEQLGQPIVIENKPGGATIIATEAVVRSKPDGYALLMISAPFVTNPGLFDKLPYDPLRDLSPLILVSENGFLIAVNASQPHRTFKELIEASRKSATGIDYATPGIGTMMHLTGQLMNAEYGTRFNNVPFKGSAQAVQNVAAAHVPMIIDPIATNLAMIKQGRIRPLAVTHSVRQPELPDVPTLRELGFQSVEVKSFSGFMVPAGTPRPVVMKLNGAYNNAIKDPEIRKQLSTQNLVGGSPEDFGAMLKREIDRWTPLIRKLGIKPGG